MFWTLFIIKKRIRIIKPNESELRTSIGYYQDQKIGERSDSESKVVIGSFLWNCFYRQFFIGGGRGDRKFFYWKFFIGKGEGEDEKSFIESIHWKFFYLKGKGWGGKVFYWKFLLESFLSEGKRVRRKGFLFKVFFGKFFIWGGKVFYWKFLLESFLSEGERVRRKSLLTLSLGQWGRERAAAVKNGQRLETNIVVLCGRDRKWRYMYIII